MKTFRACSSQREAFHVVAISLHLVSVSGKFTFVLLVSSVR